MHAAASSYASGAGNSTRATDEDGDGLHDEAGAQAAGVNNGGLPGQVPYLVAQYGAAATERIIRAAL